MIRKLSFFIISENGDMRNRIFSTALTVNFFSQGLQPQMFAALYLVRQFGIVFRMHNSVPNAFGKESLRLGLDRSTIDILLIHFIISLCNRLSDYLQHDVDVFAAIDHHVLPPFPFSRFLI